MLNATWWNGANTPIVHRAALTTSPGCTETDPQGRFKHLVSWAGRHPARCPQPAQMTSSFSFQPGLSLSTLPYSSLSCSLQLAASAAWRKPLINTQSTAVCSLPRLKLAKECSFFPCSVNASTTQWTGAYFQGVKPWLCWRQNYNLWSMVTATFLRDNFSQQERTGDTVPSLSSYGIAARRVCQLRARLKELSQSL